MSLPDGKCVDGMGLSTWKDLRYFRYGNPKMRVDPTFARAQITKQPKIDPPLLL